MFKQISSQSVKVITKKVDVYQNCDAVGFEIFISKDEKKSNNFNKIEKKIRRLAGKAIEDFKLIDDNDKVMVCVSGGKDSYTLLDVLIYFQKIAPINFELVAVNLDQHHPGFPNQFLPNYFKESEIPYKIVSQNTYKV